jgi:hypothetical protein
MSGSAASVAYLSESDKNEGLSEGAREASDTSKTPRSGGGNGPLERVTVNLIARAARALQEVAELTGDSKTDNINRAIQVYAYLEAISQRGGAIYVRESADAELERVKIF